MNGMKKCTLCNSVYTDDSFKFCLDDGTPLRSDSSTKFDPNAPTLLMDKSTALPRVVRRQFYHEKGDDKREVAYPQIQGLPNDYLQRRVNTLLRRKFLDLELPETNQADDEDNPSINENTGFGVTLVTQNVLSVHRWAAYDFGGAHPQVELEAYNVDLNSGYLYTYEDLFKLDSDYKTAIPELVITSLKKQEKKYGFFSPYDERKDENFEFYFTKKNLVMINLYMAHAVKSIVAPIRLVDIENLIHPEGPLFTLLRDSQ